MEITGTVKKILDVQQVSPTFRKRELVVQTDEQYPQPILIEFTQDRSDLLNRVQEGQKVTVSINIRGREWQGREGETRYYVSIQGWRIQNADAPVAPPALRAKPTAVVPPWRKRPPCPTPMRLTATTTICLSKPSKRLNFSDPGPTPGVFFQAWLEARTSNTSRRAVPKAIKARTRLASAKPGTKARWAWPVNKYA